MNHRVENLSPKKYREVVPIPLRRRRHTSSLPGVVLVAFILILPIFLAHVTITSHAFMMNSSHKKYLFLTRNRQGSSSSRSSILRNLISSSLVDEELPATEQEEVSSSAAKHNSLVPKKNPIFISTNVLSQHFEIPDTSFIHKISPRPPDIWERMALALTSSPPKQNNRRNCKRDTPGKMGVDETVEFQDARDGATTLVQKCLSKQAHEMDREEMESIIEYITNVLSYFQTHIQEQEPKALYKVRLVSTLGSKGQKCPRWHVDHVPLRLVLSLAGPGCVYIPMEKEVTHANFVDRNVLNESEEDDTARANEMILPRGEKELAVHAKKGDAILLMGRAWETENKNSKETACFAAPHRSPTLGSDEVRVLLVADYVSQLDS